MGDLITSISNLIENIVPKYAFLLDNGTILRSKIAEENLLGFIAILPKLKNTGKLAKNSFIHKSKLYIYCLTDHFFILLLTDLESEIIKALFSDIYGRFAIKVNNKYSDSPKTLKSVVKSIIFSMSRSMGPEPISWKVYNTEELKEEDILNISLKSMLTLTGERDGAKSKMIAFQPFIKYNSLGIVFLFSIPFKRARGLAYDSSIVILVDYNDRAIIYEKNLEIEHLLNEIAYFFSIKFNEHAKPDGNIPTNKVFDKIFLMLEKSLEEIPLNVTSKKLKEEMFNSLKNLKN
ncbi:MAG: hypothetical protein ACTSWY_09055 [Promethearchaeota archaeon]